MSNVGHAPQGVLSQALTGNVFVSIDFDTI